MLMLLRTLLLSLLYTLALSTASIDESPYVIIIDGGSTGDRLHIFEYAHDNRIVRHGSARVDEPLTNYVNNTSSQIADHLMEVFDYAKSHIPVMHQASTAVHYVATAGMRLLTEPQQARIYKNMYRGLKHDSRFVFHVEKSNLFTLSGADEGYFGAVAANVLNHHNGIIGALDMGGSSTQIAFPLGDSLHKNDFVADSYLSYGVDQVRVRLYDKMGASNPCVFDQYDASAAGNGAKCSHEMRALLQAELGSINYNISGEFWAMSLFFFTLDSLRHYSGDAAVNEHWPSPTLSELSNAAHTLCDMEWSELKLLHDTDRHTFTRDAVLPHRCFESIYMVELLRLFGFNEDTRNIQFLFQVHDSEVEWTLGMAHILQANRTSSVLVEQEDCVDTKRRGGARKNGTASVPTRRRGKNNVTWVEIMTEGLVFDSEVFR